MDYVNPSKLMLQTCGAGSGHYYVCALNPPIHPGAMNAPMPQYYTLPDQRRIRRVPRPVHLSPPYETIPAITFSVNGWPGVCVKDILDGTVVVDAADDLVLRQSGWRSIVVNLEWPGYEHVTSGNPMSSRINACPGGRDIMRQGLAENICGLLFNFHRVICKYPISLEWKRYRALVAGPEGIRVRDIVLFSLHYYRNTWIPELYVIE